MKTFTEMLIAVLMIFFWSIAFSVNIRQSDYVWAGIDVFFILYYAYSLNLNENEISKTL